MGYASQQGRAFTNPSAPEAKGVCDRCGGVHQLNRLQWQYDWRGSSIKRTGILVCYFCLDSPQEQLKAFAVPADPVTVKNPRIQDFDTAEGDFRVTSAQIVVDFWTSLKGPGTPQRATQSGGIRVTQSIGKTGGKLVPPGLDPNAAMPLFDKKKYNVVLPVSAITANGTSTVTVTCSAPHALKTNDQVVLKGCALSSTDGFYSVVVIDAINFTYNVANVILGATALLLPSTTITTTLVGVPRGLTAIPQVGP